MHGIYIAGGFGRHGAEQLQKIERRALRRQQGAGRTFDLQHHLVRRTALAFLHTPDHACLRVDLLQRGLGPRNAANDRRFARQHMSPGAASRVNQTRGQVTGADIFLQGTGRIGRASSATAVSEKSKNEVMVRSLVASIQRGNSSLTRGS